MNIEIDTSRGQLTSPSTNSSREVSVHFNASFIAYVDQIQALANNTTWTEQVEIGSLFLSYVSLKKEIKDTVSVL